MAAESPQVRFNDTISLCSAESEEDGFLSANETKICVKLHRDRHCIFNIWPVTQHSAQERYEARGRGKHEGELYEDMILEGERNQCIVAQSAGQELTYEQVVQFFHKHTNCFLAVVEEHRTKIPRLVLQKASSKSCWFKVLPAIKGKNAGDKVHADDLVLLQSMEVENAFLHQNTAFEFNGYAVTLQTMAQADSKSTKTLPTLWRMTPFTYGETVSRSVLRHKDKLRLFNPHGGYLYCRGSLASVKSKYFHSGQNDFVSSLKCAWQVEIPGRIPTNEHPEIPPDQPVHLRLFGTPYFLSVKYPESDAISPEMNTSVMEPQLSLTQSTKDRVNFRLVPTVPGLSFIPFGAEMEIVSVTEEVIQIPPDSFQHRRDAKGYTDSEVTLSKAKSHYTPFSIRKTPQYQIENWELYVRKKDSLRDPDTSAAEKRQTLLQLLAFCTHSPNGRPIDSRQSLLGKSEMLDLIVQLFTDAWAKVRPKYYDHDVAANACKLLTEICRANPKNGLAVFLKLPLTTYLTPEVKIKGMNVARLYYEIFHDNPIVLMRVDHKMIRHILEVLNARRDEDHVQLLGALCVCNNTALHTNQKIVTDLLDKYENSLAVKFSSDYVKDKLEDLVSFASIQRAVLSEVANSKDPEILLMYAMLRLYCQLTMDSNEYCMDKLDTWLDKRYKQIFLNGAYNSKLRALCCTLFINKTSPSDTGSLKHLIWVTADADHTTPWDMEAFDPTSKGKSLGRYKEGNGPISIARFCLQFLLSKEADKPSNLLLQVLRLTKYCFKAKFFSDKAQKLSPVFTKFLQMGMDDDKNYLTAEVELILQIKTVVLSLIKYYFDLQANTWFLVKFNKTANVDPSLLEIDRAFLDELQVAVLILLKHNYPKISAKAMQVMRQIELQRDRGQTLAQAEDFHLIKISPSVTENATPDDPGHRSLVLFKKFIKLVDSLKIPTIMETDKPRVVDPKAVEKALKGLREAIRHKHDKAISTSYNQKMKQNIRHAILLHLGAHRHVLKFIRRPLRSAVLIECYGFLHDVCEDDVKYQMALVQHVDFMSSQFTDYFGQFLKNPQGSPKLLLIAKAIMDAICAIYKNNYQLCHRVNDQTMIPFVDNVLRSTTIDSLRVSMAFFETVFKLETSLPYITDEHLKTKSLIHRNQNIVLKLALSRKPSNAGRLLANRASRYSLVPTALSVGSMPISGERSEPASAAAAAPPSASQSAPPAVGGFEMSVPEQLELAALHSLLALCCEGHNEFTESACQKRNFRLGPCLKESTRVITNTKYPYEVQYFILKAYLSFASEVYLNTAFPKTEELKDNKDLWMLARHLIETLEKEDNSPEAKSLKTQIGSVILPFFRHYYLLKFQIESEPLAADQSTTLLYGLVKLVSTSEGQEAMGEELTNLIAQTIYIMQQAGVKLTTEQYKSQSANKKGLMALLEKVGKKFGEAEANEPHFDAGMVVSHRTAESKGKISGIADRLVNRVPAQEGGSWVEMELIVQQILKADPIDDDALTINSIKIVEAVLCKLRPETRKQGYDSLIRMNSAGHLIRLLGSHNSELVEAAISCLLTLLSISNDPAASVSSVLSSGRNTQFYTDIANIIQRTCLHVQNEKRRLSAAPLLSSAIPAGETFKNTLQVLNLLAQNNVVFVNQANEILVEIVQFLKVINNRIGPENIDDVKLIFIALKALTQNSPVNQRTILDHHIILPINRLLAQWLDYDGLTEYQVTQHAEGRELTRELDSTVNSQKRGRFLTSVCDLKLAVIELLDGIVHSTTDESVISEIITTLGYANAGEIFKVLPDLHKMPEFLIQRTIKVATSTFRLLKLLAQKDKTANKDLAAQLLSSEQKCASRIGCVELLNNKKLTAIYFPIPQSFRTAAADEATFEAKVNQQEAKLTGKMENDFIDNSMDWSQSSTGRVEALVEWIEDYLLKKEFQLQSKRISTLAFLALKSWHIWQDLALLFAILINLLILAFATGLPDDVDWQSFASVRAIGIIQTCFSTFLFLSLLIDKGVITHRHNWKKHKDTELVWSKEFPYLRSRTKNVKKKVPVCLQTWPQIRSAMSSPCTYLGWSLWYFFARDPWSIYAIVYLIFSLLGNLVSPYFFSLHLFQVVIRVRYLRDAVRAVTRNIVTLFFLLVLMFNGIYVLSIISYIFFGDIYSFAHDEGLSGAYCNGLWECLMINLYYGVPVQGGLVSFLPAYNSQTNDKRGWWLFFQILFFFFVGTFCFNIILATIVDTLSDIRERSNAGRDALQNSCMICSQTRDTFQLQGQDFALHLTKAHNKLHYLYFIAYLKDCVRNDTTGTLSQPERDILALIKEGKILEIFPVGRALALTGEPDD